jgi:N-acetylglucosamine-6-sulfatase
MRRRTLLGAIGVAGFVGAGANAAASAGKPDIVVIVADDMRDSDWRALPQTRQWIEHDGTLFPNFVLPTPICSPSRTSLFTGMYAHNHGVRDNDGAAGGWQAFQRKRLDGQTITVALHDAGYRTALIGKYLNGLPEQGHVPAGWDVFGAASELTYYHFHLNENGRKLGFKSKENYSTDVLAAQAVDFIDGAPTTAPLALFFTPKAPHGPATPAPYAKGQYAGATADHDPSYDEDDISDKPRAVRRHHRLGRGKAKRLDRLEAKRLETLTSVDQAVAAIRDALDRRGTLANAYVFVLSDNGYQMGQHRLVAKGWQYAGSTLVTMGAVGPGFRNGATDRRLVANVDIPATMADVARVDLPRGDGRSLLATDERASMLIEAFQGPAFIGLRTPRYLYVEDAKKERELYDHQQDPFELNNLLADWEGHTPTQAALDLGETFAARLHQLEDCAGDRCRSLDTEPL